MSAALPVAPVPNSTGTTRPRTRAPQNACDSHIHIYDPRFPMKSPELRAVANASSNEYRLLQARNGTSRDVSTWASSSSSRPPGSAAAFTPTS